MYVVSVVFQSSADPLCPCQSCSIAILLIRPISFIRRVKEKRVVGRDRMAYQERSNARPSDIIAIDVVTC